MPNPMCAIQTAGNVPLMPSEPKIFSSGTSATWVGTTSRPTIRMSSRSRPGNCMKVNE
jgi:hypothetical protein